MQATSLERATAARDAGTFNWGSTLWHEIAHAVTLGASGHRVPRWLTEGVSGWEEARARPGWGDPITPSFLTAYATGKLPPLSGLTPAFVRPAYPEQVMHAYQMAELVVEHIVSTRGDDAIRRIVSEFAGGKTQTEIFRDVLKATPEQYDGEFDAYMRKRFATQFAALEGGPSSPYGTALARGREHLGPSARIADQRAELADLRERTVGRVPFGGARSGVDSGADQRVAQQDLAALDPDQTGPFRLRQPVGAGTQQPGGGVDRGDVGGVVDRSHQQETLCGRG